jgi:hypothetical protein
MKSEIRGIELVARMVT